MDKISIANLERKKEAVIMKKQIDKYVDKQVMEYTYLKYYPQNYKGNPHSFSQFVFSKDFEIYRYMDNEILSSNLKKLHELHEYGCFPPYLKLHTF